MNIKTHMSKKTTIQGPETALSNRNTTEYDLIAILFISGILLIDFFPNFGSIEIIAPQYLYLSFLNIVASLFLYKNSEAIDPSIKSILKKSWALKSYILFLIFVMIATVTAQNHSLAINNLVQLLIVFCTFYNLVLLLNKRLHLLYTICLVIGITVFIQSYLAINNLFENAKTDSLAAAFGKIQGNTGNINIFAASLTGKIPFLLLGIYHFSAWKKWFLSSCLFLASVLILLIAARASYIALFIIFIGFLLFLVLFKIDRKKYFAILPYTLLPFIFAFLVASLTFKKANDTSRFTSITERVSQINPIDSKDGSINIRLQYWNNAIQITKNNPILGVGLGNWKVESQPYEKELVDNLTVSDHPHNDFLEIAAETGFINLLVYLSLFIFSFISNIKNLKASNTNETRLIAMLALMLLVCYGIDAFFNFPLYRATMQVNFILFLVFTILNTNQIPTENYTNKNTVLIITFISAVCLYFSYQTVTAYQFENETVIDLQAEQPQLTYTKVIDRIPKFPNTATNSQPYIETAAIYAFKEKRFEQALQYFDQSQKINPYTGRAEWYKYQIYKEKGSADSARYYAHKAFEIRPRNQDYFLSALVVDAKVKDTTAILNNHNRFIKYVQDPSIWINTSSALAQSLYPNDRILKFMNTGLALFPKDSTLLARLQSFEKDAELAKSNTKNNNIGDNATIASQYATNSNFEKAIVYFKKAALEDPTNIIFTQNIGICYFQLKQFKTAINYLEKTVNSPLLADGKTEFLLGAAYLNTNNNPKGCKYLIISENKNYPGAGKLVAQYCN